MHFYFVDHVALVKQPVHEFLQKQLIAKITGQMVKHVMNVIHANRLMKEPH